MILVSPRGNIRGGYGLDKIIKDQFWTKNVANIELLFSFFVSVICSQSLGHLPIAGSRLGMGNLAERARTGRSICPANINIVGLCFC